MPKKQMSRQQQKAMFAKMSGSFTPTRLHRFQETERGTFNTFPTGKTNPPLKWSVNGDVLSLDYGGKRKTLKIVDKGYPYDYAWSFKKTQVNVNNKDNFLRDLERGSDAPAGSLLKQAIIKNIGVREKHYVNDDEYAEYAKKKGWSY